MKVLNNLAVNPSMTYNLVCDSVVQHALEALVVLHDEEKYLVVALSLVSRCCRWTRRRSTRASC